MFGGLKVAIIDYGMGNLFSVKRACDAVSLNAEITNDRKKIINSDGVLLPGVGAFGDAIENLRKLDLIGAIKDYIASGKPFMGICLGMQLLMGESEEFGIHEGLKIFPGKVVKFPPTDSEGKKIKVPEIGWEGIYSNRNNWGNSMLKGIDQNEYMYFVHSFYVVPDSKEIILSLSKYEGIEYASSLSKDNIFACQFHPERSAEKGLIIYRNFAQSLKIGGNDDK